MIIFAITVQFTFLMYLQLNTAQDRTLVHTPQMQFSLAAYNKFFVHNVYVYRGELNNDPCDWPFLRCTCYGTSVHNACEHIAFCREIPFPGMNESPLSRDTLGILLEEKDNYLSFGFC